MNGGWAGILAFICLGGASLAGVSLRARAAASLSRPGVVDAITRIAWIIGIFTAVALAALVAYLKISFDTASRDVRAFSYEIVDLDHALRRVGPPAAKPRALLFRYASRTMKDVWPNSAVRLGPDDFDAARLFNELETSIAALLPGDSVVRSQLHDINQLLRAVGRGRWTLDQRSGRALSPWTLATMMFWTMSSFFILGLSAPRNRVILGAIGLCALVLASAVFLVVEYADPYQGIIIVSPEPMRTALFTLSE